MFHESIHLEAVYLGEDRAQAIKVGIPSQHGKGVLDLDTTQGLEPNPLLAVENLPVTLWSPLDPWFHILRFSQPQIG